MNAWRRYWFELPVSRAKLDLFRFAFFGLLALDCFLDLSHAPRYGAGGFNVGQLSWLDPLLPMPTRIGIALCCLLGSYLALRVALGVAITTSVRLLTALFGYRYFISQLDSYQHHYLVFLLLLIACFVPWEESRRRPTDGDGRIRHWAIRLLVVQVAILYFWAAVSKMTGQWVDGTTLQQQITTQDSWLIEWLTGQPSGSDLIQSLLGPATAGDPGGFTTAARLVLGAELLLTLMLLYRPLWPFAILIGVPFHLSVELFGFKIGLFSWFMVAFYLLLLPDRWLDWPGRQIRRAQTPLWRLLDRVPATPATAIALVLVVAGALLIGLTPFEGTALASGLIVALGAFAVIGRNRAAARGQATPAAILGAGAVSAAACAALLLLHGATDQAFDYYKFMGGSARRLGNDELAERAYRRLLELDPDYARAHYHLGNLAYRDDDPEAALEHWRAAQAADPPDGDSFAAEVRLHASRRDRPRAVEVARACVQALPRDTGCAQLLRQLSGGRAAPAPRDPAAGGDHDGGDDE